MNGMGGSHVVRYLTQKLKEDAKPERNVGNSFLGNFSWGQKFEGNFPKNDVGFVELVKNPNQNCLNKFKIECETKYLLF